jgi:hypothetical protein
MPKLFATTTHRTTDETDARAVVAHMLDNNQSVVKNITPCVILAEIDFADGGTGWYVIELRVNGYGPDVDVDVEGGEALAEWKQRAHELPTGAEVVNIECFTVETEYVRPPFNPNRTAYNPTSVGYALR